jgi:hypothetical protein
MNEGSRQNSIKHRIIRIANNCKEVHYPSTWHAHRLNYISSQWPEIDDNSEPPTLRPGSVEPEPEANPVSLSIICHPMPKDNMKLGHWSQGREISSHRQSFGCRRLARCQVLGFRSYNHTKYQPIKIQENGTVQYV